MRFIDAGSAISVTVNRTENVGSITSDPATVPQPSVNISGSTYVGQELTANISNLGGIVSYQWRRNGTINIGGNSNTYTLQTADLGSVISVFVFYPSVPGSVTSTQTDHIIWPPLTGTVSITGVPKAGQRLTANISNLGGNGTISYQWIRNGSVNIGTNSSTYTLTNTDVGTVITVNITRSENTGSITSEPFDVPNVDIGIGDPYVRLFLGSSPLANGGTTVFNREADIFIVSISPGTYSNIIWYSNGSVIAEGAARTSITLSKQTIGTFHIVVTATPSGGVMNSGSHTFIIQ